MNVFSHSLISILVSLSETGHPGSSNIWITDVILLVLAILCRSLIVIRINQGTTVYCIGSKLGRRMRSHRSWQLCAGYIDVFDTSGRLQICRRQRQIVSSSRPIKLALMGFLVCRSVLLCASGVDVNKVPVRVILVGMAVACFLILVRSGFRAIVHVTDVVKLEFLPFQTAPILQGEYSL